jgi:bifunctional NMN adenylyltransferase/nudix hydrolase
MFLEQKRSEDVGVIVGRFQVSNLHEGHVSLIETVFRSHKRVFIMVGVTQAIGTKRNPMNYETRAQMLQAAFPEAVIVPLADCQSDVQWSQELDRLIHALTAPSSVVIYGSRDSFISHYKGALPTAELDVALGNSSGTELRKLIGRVTLPSQDFRAGIIYASQNRWPLSIPTVDTAVIKDDIHILLVKNRGSDAFKLPGGFVSSADVSLEEAAKRECYEETGILPEGKPQFVCSMRMPDWRYTDNDASIITTLFKSNYTGGTILADDDAIEAEWFNLNNIGSCSLIHGHRQLIQEVKNAT